MNSKPQRVGFALMLINELHLVELIAPPVQVYVVQSSRGCSFFLGTTSVTKKAFTRHKLGMGLMNSIHAN